MQVTTIGLDLAKNIFQIHGIYEDGEVAFNRALRRAQVLTFFESLEPCLVGIEACGTSHHWAPEISKLGQEVKLSAVKYSQPTDNTCSFGELVGLLLQENGVIGVVSLQFAFVFEV